MRNIDPFNDWMNDFEIPKTNEWREKITLSDISQIKKRS